MCFMFGEWEDDPECAGCKYREEMDHEEDQVPVPEGD